MLFQVKCIFGVVAAVFVHDVSAGFVFYSSSTDKKTGRPFEPRRWHYHGGGDRWEDNVHRGAKSLWHRGYKDRATKDSHSGDAEDSIDSGLSLAQKDVEMSLAHARERTEAIRKEFIAAREAELNARRETYAARRRLDDAIASEHSFHGSYADREHHYDSKHFFRDEGDDTVESGSGPAAEGLVDEKAETKSVSDSIERDAVGINGTKTDSYEEAETKTDETREVASAEKETESVEEDHVSTDTSVETEAKAAATAMVDEAESVGEEGNEVDAGSGEESNFDVQAASTADSSTDAQAKTDREHEEDSMGANAESDLEERSEVAEAADEESGEVEIADSLDKSMDVAAELSEAEQLEKDALSLQRQEFKLWEARLQQIETVIHDLKGTTENVSTTDATTTWMTTTTVEEGTEMVDGGTSTTTSPMEVGNELLSEDTTTQWGTTGAWAF